MTARYAHARHHLALAFFCGHCRHKIGLDCTGSIIHAARRRLVPPGISDEHLDEVMEMIVTLRMLRKSGPSAEVAAAELEQKISDLMVRIKNDTSLTV
jgi:hypothetical protein